MDKTSYDGNMIISFIIPAFNSGATINECLSSVFGQNAWDISFEVLLIDNGSTDRTVAIAREMGAKVLEGPGLTVAALRNLGARHAGGNVLAFVDSDCVISRNWLQNALPLFDDPRVGAVGAPTSVPENGTWVQRTWYMHRKKKSGREFVEWLPTENLLVKREIFEKVGGFNEELVTCEDVDLCYRIGESHKIICDTLISSVHLGEAKTLRQFYRKERWRGIGSFRGIALHGLKADEIPSLLMNLYALIIVPLLIIGLFLFIFSSYVNVILVGLALSVFPPLIMSSRTSLKIKTHKFLMPLIILYVVYLGARTASTFSRK